MNVASKDLCVELYELSGWDTGTTGFHHYDGMVVFGWIEESCPAYDLSYLLRKLPPNIGEYRLTLLQYFTKRGKTLDGWQAYYKTSQSYLGLRYAQEADTPEDAACKLAIELFKQGVLK